MKRLFVILIASILPLVLAPTAQAKGPVKNIQVCGYGGCATIPVTPGRGVGRPDGILLLMGTPATQVPGPRPYVDLNVTLGLGEGTMSMFYVPGVQVVLSDRWSQVPPDLGAKLDAAAARVGARKPTIAAVAVGERTSGDPGAYAPLLGSLQPAPAPDPFDASRVGIRFTTTEPTPWTPRGDGYASYVPSAHLIGIGLDWFRPTAALDAQLGIDSGAERSAPAVAGDGLSPWWLVLPAAGAMAGLLVVIVRRRRAHPGTVTVA